MQEIEKQIRTIRSIQELKTETVKTTNKLKTRGRELMKNKNKRTEEIRKLIRKTESLRNKKHEKLEFSTACKLVKIKLK